MKAPILAGLRVVEISAFVAAPLAGASLAGLGADVIRVDPPGGGSDIGRWPTYRGRSLYWAGLNQGKRSVVVDLRTDVGRKQVTKLITAPGEGGGIFLTNLAVTDWNSYATLSSLRNDLIMVAITGSHDGRIAVDYTVNAALGFPYITGPEGHVGPVNHVLPAWDALTGYLACTAILAAERFRRVTGRGQLVEISLADVGLAITGHLGFLAEAVLIDEPRHRFGNDLYGSFSHDFETRDGSRVIVVALTPRQWQNLVKATDLGSQFETLEARLGLDLRREEDRWQARREICLLLVPWIAAHDLDEVRQTFDRCDVLWAPYQTFKELIADSATTARSVVSEVEHPGIGRIPTVGSPLRFQDASYVGPLPAPMLGQDTDGVFDEFHLGE